MRHVLRSIPLVIALVVVAFSASAADWNWAYVASGAGIVVLQGKAEVERKGSRVTAVLREPDEPKHHSTFAGRLRNGRLSGTLEVSRTDTGPDFLSQGRWRVHKTEAGETIEKIWLYGPSTGNYLVLTRLTPR